MSSHFRSFITGGSLTPSSHVVAGYVERELIAGARLVIIGVGIGAVAAGHGRGIATLVAFLLVDAIAEDPSPPLLATTGRSASTRSRIQAISTSPAC